MTDTVFRKYNFQDVPALKALWQQVFGDPDEMIDGFFELLPAAGYGVVAQSGGRPVSMAYVLDGLTIGEKKACYIYAVATLPEFRGHGLGAEVVKKCAEYAGADGCDIICTSPAEASLYGWYEELIGTRAAVYSSSFRVSKDDGWRGKLNIERANSGEYNTLREKLLAGAAHVCFPGGYMAIEEMICTVCGGGLFRVGDGIAACYPDGDELLIKELICPESDLHGCVASLMTRFGAKSASVHDCGRLKPFIAAAPAESVPEGCWWGLALD